MSAWPPDDRTRMLDQQVLAILRTSGGWNAHARARLAAFAESRRVPLEAVVASALRVAAGAAAGVSGAAEAGAVGAGPVRPGAVVVAADGDAAGKLPRARSRGIGLVAGLATLVAACAASVWLVWYAVDRAASPMTVATVTSDGADDTDSAKPTREPPDARGEPGDTTGLPAAPRRAPAVPNARDVPPVPAMYARPPVLRPDPSPAWAQTALETVASLESTLAEASARVAAGGATTDADRDLLGRACDSLASAWPLTETRRRDDLLSDLCRLDQSLAAERAPVREVLEAMRALPAADPAGMWRSAGAAGM
ncbi:MAG: hypothetical protein ACKOEP_04130, partial [Phycisphaerales bacterium]